MTAIVLLACLADWPQWRGPARDGHADARLPDRWPEKAPAPLWKREVGAGQGGPVVAGGRVFVMGRVGAEEVCYGLDGDTGKVLWRHAQETPYKPADRDAGQGPKSTPTVSGGRVFMLGVAGRLSCFTVAGKRAWTRDLKADFWGEAKDRWGDDAYSTCCGAAASPLVDGDQLILPVGGKKAGAMAAFDVKTGKTLWRSPAPDRSSYASPVTATLGGRRQVVGFTGLRMAGFTPDAGKLLWSHDFPQDYEQTIVSPIIHEGLVIFGGKNAELVALKITAKGAEVAWTNAALRAYTTTPVAFGGHCLGLNMRGDLVRVDLKTGKTAWVRKGFADNYNASLVVAGKRILILTQKGELHAVVADPRAFRREGVWKVAEPPVWPGLAVAGSRLYVKDESHVYCYDLTR